MSNKYELLVCDDNWFIKKSLVENADENLLIYEDGYVVGIRAGEDSGIDMFYPQREQIAPGETKIIGLEIHCKMMDTIANKSVAYYMYPRSSISKTPLRLANSVGIIDKDYRGELKCALHNTPNIAEYMRDCAQDKDVDDIYTFTVDIGTRLVQICAPDLSPLSIKFVSSLDTTARGAGGFGSTGT